MVVTVFLCNEYSDLYFNFIKKNGLIHSGRNKKNQGEPDYSAKWLPF